MHQQEYPRNCNDSSRTIEIRTYLQTARALEKPHQGKTIHNAPQKSAPKHPRTQGEVCLEFDHCTTDQKAHDRKCQFCTHDVTDSNGNRRGISPGLCDCARPGIVEAVLDRHGYV